MDILVTGGCGFIGSHFIRRLLARWGQARVINLDKLTYSALRDNLADVEAKYKGTRYFFVHGDICDVNLVNSVFNGSFCDADGTYPGCAPDIVINFAAESHVDRSIDDSSPFIQTNILGAHVLLEAFRRNWRGVQGSSDGKSGPCPQPRFLQVSTDEVYGCLGEEGYFTEGSPLMPNSPYAASKASADLLARCYHQTYGLPVIVTRSANNYGPYQFPEKFIPLMIQRALAERPLPIYGDGRNVRSWLYVEDHCDAILRVLERGAEGEVYNIGGAERRNLDVAERILQMLGKPKSLISFVPDRLGHDWRYALDCSRVTGLGWQPKYGFEEGLELTLRWYVEHADWWVVGSDSVL